jgi:signal transduction histidine kinase
MRETGLPLTLIDPRFALDDFVEKARAMCGKRRVAYIQNHCGGGQVRAEPHWISVVLRNLLVYALSTSKSGATIRLQSNIDALSWRVELEQQGVTSVGPERLQQIVERLFRLPKINEGTSSCIALALSKSIITLHSGRIWAEPSPASEGLRFLFTIPASSRLECTEASASTAQ